MVHAVRQDSASGDRAAPLGGDLRALRKARGLTLSELAFKVGRSVGWLSQIERDLTQPTIADLRRLADALDQPVSLFFGAPDAPAEERGYVVRADTRRSLGNSEEGLVEQLLSPDLGGSFEIVRSVFAPGAELSEPAKRPTEEAGYVVSGTLDLWIGERLFHLVEGDSFRFTGEPYRWRNPGDQPCIAIWVIAPHVLMLIDPTTLATFLLASMALYLTPGADMMFISASGAAGGKRTGIMAGLGVSIGSFSHTIFAVLGVAALIQTSTLAYDVLRYAGAAYLVYLAVQTWRAPLPEPGANGSTDDWEAFRRGALTNLLNPKVSVFVLAFLPQFADPANGPVWLQIAILGSIFSLASIPFNCGYGIVAGAFTDTLRKMGRSLNRVCALVFCGLAARLAIN
ncbi:MAG: LysE family transporter [Pseudomonadota bacterium]